jgi:hypothetical protein
VKQIEAERSHLISPIIFVVAVVAAMIPLFVLDPHGGGSQIVVFILLNLGLISYIVWEIMRLYRRNRRMALVQPPVIASIMLFGRCYIMPNIPTLFGLDNPIALRFIAWRGDYQYWLNMAFLGVCLAVFAMWRGYNGRVGERLAVRIQEFLLRRNLVASSFNPNMQAVVVLTLLSVAAVFVQVRLGIFGYSSTRESLQEAQGVSAWLNLVSQGGSLAFLVLCLKVFSAGRRAGAAVWALFIAVLVWQFTTGFLSGFKSQVVIPVIVLGVAYYMARGRLSLGLVVLSFVMLVAAFQTIEPFRKARYLDPGFDGTSVSSIVGTFWNAATHPGDFIPEKDSMSIEEIASRTDLITFTAVSFDYGHNRELDENAPRFVMDLLLIPLNAFVPRFLWSGKSIANDGWWFNAYVLGNGPETFSSVGMGPVSYLYFGGGFVMVFAGFYFIGVLQRVAFSAFVPLGLGGWIIFLGALPTLAMMPSNVAAGLTGLVRMLPFLILAQLWVIRKR